jgi:hypothetical protein
MYHNADSGRVYIRLGELEGREFMAEGKINAEGLEQAILTVRAGRDQPITSPVSVDEKYVHNSLSVQRFAS